MSQVAAAGRLLLSPFTGAATWFNSSAKAHPFLTGVVSTGLKTSAADIFAQKVVENRKDIDWTRHAVFCLFGFGYLGAFQYYLYNIKFTQWCGPLTKKFGHKMTSPIKVLIDQGLHHPFVYFPVFFSMKAVVSGKPLSTAVEKYRTEIWDSVKAMWGVWVPAQIINFAFVPRHLRLPYVAAVSFGWTIILSVMQNKFDSAKAANDKLLDAVVEKNKSPAIAATVQTAAAASQQAALSTVNYNMNREDRNQTFPNGRPAVLVPSIAHANDN